MTAPEGYQLSPVQRRLRARDAGPVRVRLALAGPIEEDRLRAALDAVTARHEALRLRLVEHPVLRLPLQAVQDSPPAEPALTASVSGDELVLTASALAADPASLILLLPELAAAYGGRLPADDPERLQYLDVSEWLVEEAAAGGPAPAAAALTRIPPVANATAVGAGGSVVGAELDGQELAALRGCPVAGGLPTLVAAATAAALVARAGLTDEGARLVLALQDPGRSAPGTEAIVGPLADYRPLELPLPLPVATDLVDAVAATAGPTWDPARDALVRTDAADAWVSLVRLPEPAALAPLPVRSVTVEQSAPAGALHLAVVETAGALRLTLRNGPAGPGARRLLDGVVAALTGLPAALATASAVPALGPAETALLTTWSGASAGTVPAGTLTAVLDAGIAGTDPDRTAVRAPDGALTYAELDAAADDLALRLRAAGVVPESRVLVPATRSWRTVAAFLGILRAGGAYVPLDPDQPGPRLADLVGAARAQAVAGPAGVFPGLPAVPVDRVAGAPDRPRPVAGPGNAAYVIFTSGSTGTPRPVVVEHGAAAGLPQALAGAAYPAVTGLRIAVNAPFSFDASIKQLVQLAAGHTLYVLPEEVRRDGAALLDHLAELGADVLDSTPSHLGVLLDAADRPGAPALPGLLLVGGEPVEADLWWRLADRPGVRAVNLYGPTECTVDVTACAVAGTEPAIGRPLPGTAVWVLDSRLRPVAAGADGELCVSGDRLARGYLGADRDTAERFVTAMTPDGRRTRLYRTGDLVAYDEEGRLRFRGRSDDQVKIDGHRIEPGEIAAALAGHPAVDRAVVVRRTDGGTGRLVAYAVTAPDRSLSALADLEGVNPHETRYLYDEIVLQQVYLRGGITLRPGAVVLDVGANIGMFTRFVLATCPTARVHAFEPLDTARAALTANVAAVAGQVAVHPYGLSDSDREETFAVYPGYSMMSGQLSYADPEGELAVVRTFLTNERDQGLPGRDELLRASAELLADRFRVVEEPVRLRRLSDVLDEVDVDRIDLLKIDVQRAELDVLAGLDDRHWPAVQQVAMEVHDAPEGPTAGRLQRTVALLEARGFQVTVEQDSLLHGTDRHSLQAVRPEYAEAPSAVGGTIAAAAAPADGTALRDWLADRVPAAFVPAAVVVLDRLPLTANGKLDRSRLPAPEDSERAAPANRAEEVLVEVWRQVLGRADVGVEDPFHRLGGDSIRGIRVRAAAARRGLTFPLRDMFRYPTIRELVRETGLAGASATPAPDPVEVAFELTPAVDRDRLPAGLEDAFPMGQLQLGMLYHGALSPDRTAFHVVSTHRAPVRLDPELLATALQRVAARHPMLRTSFDLGRFSEPLQLVHRAVHVPLAVEDEAGPDRLNAVVAEERSRPFDPAVAPLLRARALRSGPAGFVLVLSHHHAVLDGWSLHVLLDDLAAEYGRLLVADPATGPAGRSYRDYLRQELRTRRDAEVRNWWSGQLAGVRPLYLGRPAGGGPDGQPRITSLHLEPLPAGLVDRLDRAAADEMVPLRSLLLAAHVRTLGELTGRDDIVAGLVVSVRPEEDGSDRALGLFLNSVPIRTRLGTASLGELAARLWTDERNLAGRHQLPLADLHADHGPLFDVFLNITRFHHLGDPGLAWSRADADRPQPVDVGFTAAIDVELDPAGSGLRLSVQFDPRLLAGSRVADYAARYAELLTLAGSGPTGLQASLPPTTGGSGTGPRDWRPALSRLWTGLTGATPRDGDRFLDAGGSSLLALRLAAALRDRYDLPIDLPAVLLAPTFGDLVALVTEVAPGVPVGAAAPG